MKLAPLVENFQADDQSWLGSAHGTNSARSITLDVSKFTAGTHYPNGYIPSGCALGVVTASGKYGPYNSAASDGTQTFVGLLFTAAEVNTTDATVAVVAPMFDHGRVIQAKMPFQSGTGSIDSAGKTAAAGRMWFV